MAPSFLRRILCLCLFTFAGSQPVWAQMGGRGAFEFLKLSPFSRAVGMGESYSAIGDDVAAIQYNPAGLANVLSNDFNFAYLSLYQGVSLESIAVAVPLDTQLPAVGGTVAASVNLIQGGTFQRTDDLGNPAGSFTAGDDVITLAYARALGLIQVGASVKFIQQQIDTVQSSLFAADAGVVVTPSFPGLRVGLTLKNIGAQDNTGYDLPMLFNASVSYRRYEIFTYEDDGALTAETDVPVHPIEDPVGMRVGAEYNFKWVGSRATLRMGYKFLDESLAGVGFTVGAGYALDLDGAVVFLDYAFAPEDVFGASNRISLSTKF
ncbi:MAG TPA: PorV/PorQ family protein [bacterium]|nr:PorV/PorQ family protein [bacterium]